MANCKTPCPECAFRRDIKPGALGGSHPEVYVGQLHGPFMIPCHLHYPKDDPNQSFRKTDAVFEIPQCAGAAVMRANIGRDKILPVEIHRLPKDTTLVFTSYAEFYAHHKGISLFDAERQLLVLTPAKLLDIELTKASVRRKEV
jgi:hypothetical protein